MKNTPWKLSVHEPDIKKAKLDDLLCTVRDSRNHYIASMNKVDAATYDDTIENGKLMAAAPELLEGLEEALHLLYQCSPDNTDTFDYARTLKNIEVTINKAKGL